MNLVKLAKDLYQFIEEVQSEARAHGEHLAALDPFEKQLKQDLNDLLDETSYEDNTHHGFPFSSRARRARRFFESMHRRYGK